MARKSYHRTFNKKGKSFLAQPVPKVDKKSLDEKWLIEMKVNGRYHIVHDQRGNIPKFKTLREAQSYAFFVAIDPWPEDLAW